MKLKFLLLTIMTILVSACTENNPDDIINLEEITPGDGKIVDNPLSGEICSSNEILYISTTESVIDFSFENLIENTYQNGVGRLRFSDNVTMISTNGFQGENIKFIKLPNDVSIIEDRAFAGCPLLQGISVGNKLKQIGIDAFRGCTMMKRVDINDLSSWCEIIFTNSSSNPLHIGARLYLNENEVKSLSFPANIQELKPYTFANCISLENVAIGNNVTEIGDYAFAYCKSLENVTIGNNVTEIGDYAFANCISLMDVSIGKNVSLIAPYAFSECKALKSIIIPDSVIFIGECAFVRNSSLMDVTLGKNVRIIGKKAFAACIATNIIIPESVIEIEAMAFWGCSGKLTINSRIIERDYTSRNYPNSIDCEYNWLYGSTFSQLSIGDNIKKIGDYAFFDNSFSSVDIGDNVTSIGELAFANSDDLTNVTIPESVTELGDRSFLGCQKLTAFYGKFSSTDHRCLIINGVLNSFAPAEVTEYAIPADVTKIGNGAFAACKNLISVTIPDSVTEIGEMGFGGCTSFTNITIPDSVTKIGNEVFYGCTSLANVAIGSGVTSIGAGEFNGCTSLTNITIPDGVTKIGNEAFYGCTSLANVTIGNRVTMIGEKGFNGCTSLTSITIPDSVTKIEQEAFFGCSSMCKVIIGSGVRDVGYSAFEDCYFLNEIICKPTTPPDPIWKRDEWDAFYNNAYDCRIYVPMESVNIYKTAKGWRDYADIIVGIPN